MESKPNKEGVVWEVSQCGITVATFDTEVEAREFADDANAEEEEELGMELLGDGACTVSRVATVHPFTPTHKITLTDRDGTVTTTLVQLVDGVAYTRAEWDSDASADWEYDPVSGWTFQGRQAPHAWQTVEVRPIASAH